VLKFKNKFGSLRVKTKHINTVWAERRVVEY
jgi:hypothetical protein